MSLHGLHVHIFDGRLYFGAVHGLHHFHCYSNVFYFGSHEVDKWLFLSDGIEVGNEEEEL